VAVFLQKNGRPGQGVVCFFIDMREGADMAAIGLSILEEIMDRIRQLMQSNQRLKLVNNYKGVTLHRESPILAVEEQRATLRCGGRSLSCLIHEKTTYLQNDSFPNTVSAQLQRLNLDSGTIVLTGFQYTGRKWEERKESRVQPRQSLRAHLRIRGAAFRAGIADLSVHGAGLFVHHLTEGGPIIEPETPVELRFLLPNGGEIIEKGAVISVTAVPGSCLARLSLSTTPRIYYERSLERYVHSRESEILEELEQRYASATEPKYTHQLYF
jgi:hypothetical protein